jgi:hypothetical protein
MYQYSLIYRILRKKPSMPYALRTCANACVKIRNIDKVSSQVHSERCVRTHLLLLRDAAAQNLRRAVTLRANALDREAAGAQDLIVHERVQAGRGQLRGAVRPAAGVKGGLCECHLLC